MRVGIEIGPITQNRTGVGNYCFFLLKHLLSLADDLEIRGFAASLRPLDLGRLGEGLRRCRIPLPTRAMYKVWDIAGMPAVDLLLGGVDVFHATNFYLPPARRARRVLTIHDLAFLAVPHLCSPKVVGPFSAGIHRFAREADRILAVSESTRRDVVRLLDVPPEKVRVTHLAADESVRAVPRDEAAARVAARSGVEGPFVLFVSTLEPRKNVVGLLHAFRKLVNEFPHRLVMLGGLGWNSEEILAVLRDPILESRVLRPGFVPFSELPSFYSAADACVLPSHYEGFGLPVLEAMTCGCPVIASNCSSLPEVGGDAARYCDPDDVDSLATLLGEVLSDPGLRSRMIAAGQEQACRFSWRACAESTLAAYREVVG